MTYVSYASVTAIGVVFPVVILIALGLRIDLFRRSKKIQVDDVLVIPAVVGNSMQLSPGPLVIADQEG